ncbi:hypothetical protein [Massilia sp. METH4]|uniref:hypothetical protein n=1 Tax=Massilia sp. METH4 TaxID=3123041 RepID=UPI0030D083B0
MMRPLFAALFAAHAALAAPPAAAQYMEPGLGRLFTTPDERVNYERHRTSAPAAAAMPQQPEATSVTPVLPAPPPAATRFTGMVRRSDGRATIWIDGEPRETTLARLPPGSAIPLDTPAGRILVKPGQRYDPTNGTIQDAR